MPSGDTPVTISAVLFDFGGVITSSPFEAFARFERERQLPDGFIRRVNATDLHTNAWARLERSELALEDFDRAFAIESASLGHEVPGREVLALLAGDLRPSMVEAVRRCHERFRTGLLTNNFLPVDAPISRLDGDDDDDRGSVAETTGGYSAVLSHFDVIVESSRLGVRKPSPEFYEHACDLLGIEPADAVFLDDLGVNLKPARAMGMTTIKVDDPEVALDELEAVLGIPLRD
jgi:putative hydrolase of the HAD superfamily